jgi:hypothetical protein
MKKKRFIAEQTIKILKDSEMGVKNADICRN